MNDNPEPVIKYMRLDPFTIAFSNEDTREIYVDQKFRGTPYEGAILAHELSHLRMKKGLTGQLAVEFRTSSPSLGELKIKPLAVLASFVPFIYVPDKRKWAFSRTAIVALPMLAAVIAVVYLVLAFP